MKYFLLGAFASAFFLYGWRCSTATPARVDLAGDPAARVGSSNKPDVLLYLGLALLLVGLLFKAGVAPFHIWTPDVYQGAPTPVTAFMAACTKVAAFGAILRVLYVAFSTDPVGLAAGHLGRRDRHRWWSARPRPDPDRHQADAGLLLDRARRVHPGRPGRAATGTGLSSHAVLPADVRLHHDRRVRLVTLVRDADGEATHLSQWAGLARKALPSWPRVMTHSCCWRWPASR